jgi:hypothetical protein
MSPGQEPDSFERARWNSLPEQSQRKEQLDSENFLYI